MTVVTKRFTLSTKGNAEIIDITGHITEIVESTDIKEGIVTVFIPGSTASVTTIEYEPGLVRDFPDAMERLAPGGMKYFHDATWGDGNGHSHVRASIIGPSLVVPFQSKMLMLGTWQQITLIDFDNRARSREVIVQVMGE